VGRAPPRLFLSFREKTGQGVAELRDQGRIVGRAMKERVALVDQQLHARGERYSTADLAGRVS
jgi:hypothetical protein